MRRNGLKPGERGDLDGIAFEVAGTTQKEAAALLGIDQPKVSKLSRGQLRGFSTDRLN